jgi:hypothetical protein
MQTEIKDHDLQTLLVLYNQEIDMLKEKLLNGETWDNLKKHRKNITELAIAIHKNGYILPNKLQGNPAEFPQIEKKSDQPTQEF